MKKFFAKIGLGMLRKILVARAGDPKFRKQIVALINNKIDMPNLNEDQERRIIDNLYGALEVLVELL